MWDLSSPTRDQTYLPCTARQILNHWITREDPGVFFNCSIIALKCWVSFCYTTKWITICIHMSPVTVVGLKPTPQPRLEWSLVDGHVHSWLLREPKGDTPSLERQAGLAATVISHPTCSLQCDLVTLPSRGGPLNWHFSKADIQMAKKHMEWCPVYLIIRETQIETTVRNHSTLAKMAIIKSLQTINAGEGVEKREPSCWWECKLVQPPWRTVWKLLKKLKVEPPKAQHSHSSAKTQRKP